MRAAQLHLQCGSAFVAQPAAIRAVATLPPSGPQKRNYKNINYYTLPPFLVPWPCRLPALLRGRLSTVYSIVTAATFNT